MLNFKLKCYEIGKELNLHRIKKENKRRKKEVQQKFESEKRCRSFKTSWKSTFLWLVYNPDRDVNVCTKGLKYQAGTPGSFLTGTENFKIDVIKT